MFVLLAGHTGLDIIIYTGPDAGPVECLEDELGFSYSPSGTLDCHDTVSIHPLLCWVGPPPTGVMGPG